MNKHRRKDMRDAEQRRTGGGEALRQWMGKGRIAEADIDFLHYVDLGRKARSGWQIHGIINQQIFDLVQP